LQDPHDGEVNSVEMIRCLHHMNYIRFLDPNRIYYLKSFRRLNIQQ
jgi:hypothetical protein